MVSFAGKLVGYKIVYMLLFLICLCLYQVGTDRQIIDSGSVVQRFLRCLIRSVALWWNLRSLSSGKYLYNITSI